VFDGAASVAGMSLVASEIVPAAELARMHDMIATQAGTARGAERDRPTSSNCRLGASHAVRGRLFTARGDRWPLLAWCGSRPTQAIATCGHSRRRDSRSGVALVPSWITISLRRKNARLLQSRRSRRLLNRQLSPRSDHRDAIRFDFGKGSSSRGMRIPLTQPSPPQSRGRGGRKSRAFFLAPSPTAWGGERARGLAVRGDSHSSFRAFIGPFSTTRGSSGMFLLQQVCLPSEWLIGHVAVMEFVRQSRHGTGQKSPPFFANTRRISRSAPITVVGSADRASSA